MIEVQSRTSCEDLLKEKDKEIEKLVDELEEQERNIKEANVEIEKLHSIIKEVREKTNIIQFTIESNDKRYGNLYVKLKDTQQGQELLEILKGEDKENI